MQIFLYIHTPSNSKVHTYKNHKETTEFVRIRIMEKIHIPL